MNRRDLLKATLLLLSAKARISFCTPATPTSYSHRLWGLSQYIGDVMARFHIPGTAVAIVLGDDTLFCQGFGVCDVATVAVPHLQSTLSIWYLHSASELQQDGDTGGTVASPQPSNRYGIEWANYYTPQ